MAVYAITSEYVSLNAVDESANIQSATLSVDVDQLDPTNMGSGGWKEALGGLKSGQLSITFNDDVAASALDSRLWPLLGTVVAFEVRPTSAAVGTSNPKWTGSVLISGHSIGGDVGSLAQKSLTFQTTGAITRATA